MKKTQKGLTLVEVLVSIAVFTIISLVMFSSLLAMTKVVALQDDYARIEMACHDMNAYWDMYGPEWDKYYFGEQNGEKTGYLKYQDGQLVVATKDDADFEVKYDYYTIDDNTPNCLKITSVYSKSKDREYLSDPIYCGIQNPVPSIEGGT